jgi:hypothetical protein
MLSIHGKRRTSALPRLECRHWRRRHQVGAEEDADRDRGWACPIVVQLLSRERPAVELTHREVHVVGRFPVQMRLRQLYKSSKTAVAARQRSADGDHVAARAAADDRAAPPRYRAERDHLVAASRGASDRDLTASPTALKSTASPRPRTGGRRPARRGVRLSSGRAPAGSACCGAYRPAPLRCFVFVSAFAAEADRLFGSRPGRGKHGGPVRQRTLTSRIREDAGNARARLGSAR